MSTVSIQYQTPQGTFFAFNRAHNLDQPLDLSTVRAQGEAASPVSAL